jgi:hypothetical protein
VASCLYLFIAIHICLVSQRYVFAGNHCFFLILLDAVGLYSTGTMDGREFHLGKTLHCFCFQSGQTLLQKQRRGETTIAGNLVWYLSRSDGWICGETTADEKIRSTPRLPEVFRSRSWSSWNFRSVLFLEILVCHLTFVMVPGS